MLGYWRDFGVSVLKAWWGWLPSSALAALLGFGSNLWSWQPSKAIYIVIIVLGLLFSFFSAWKKERVIAEEEVAKRGRPQLTATIEAVSSVDVHRFPRMMLRLHNGPEQPAVNIFVEDIRNGPKVLRFEPPMTIRNDHSEWIDCHILQDGKKDANNVSAIFEHPVKPYAGSQSPSLRMKIRFSNLDSAEAQRLWELTFLFWWDGQKRRVVFGPPTVALFNPKQSVHAAS